MFPVWLSFLIQKSAALEFKLKTPKYKEEDALPK